MQTLAEDYAHAIEVNHLALAMTYVHEDSPDRLRMETELADQLSWCLERAETLSFGPATLQGGTATASIVQRLVRVFGLKISYSTRASAYVFRRQDGEWRIWNVEPQPLGAVGSPAANLATERGGGPPAPWLRDR
jgi:hypothetical protein